MADVSHELRFKDKVAIVTGGCSGIGRGCVDVLDEIGSQLSSVDTAGELFYVLCDMRKEEDIKAESVSPDCIDTPLFRRVGTGEGNKTISEETLKHFGSIHTLNRIGQLREIGLACLFLAVDATFTTGEELMCTGGAEIGYGTLNRIGQPREIGLACLVLAVDATFTTGEELMCTGGAEIGYGVKQ